MNVHFSSRKNDWATPWALFRHWDAVQGPFSLDVCASAENAKCERYFSPEQDGLAHAWDGVCWMNPPYGRAIGRWIGKAAAEVRAGRARRVVCLIPARTDTIWWHEYIMPRGVVHFLRGRVRFEGALYPAPFPSAVVVFT
ncbi:MAG: phage N-6-adenine-methyltransferase [Desulfovibrio sp.]|jgi:site-specific DNA-methyltransferase (adenine-specific)|nr:phage N-6-adenine-methyltransferase [Desulfovibrio sp.]